MEMTLPHGRNNAPQILAEQAGCIIGLVNAKDSQAVEQLQQVSHVSVELSEHMVVEFASEVRKDWQA